MVKAGTATGKPRGLWRGCGAQCPRTPPWGRPLGPKALAVFRSGHGVFMTAGGTRFGVQARSGLPGSQGGATDDARWPGRKKPGPSVGAGTLRSARPAHGWRRRAGVGSRLPDRAGSLSWPPGMACSRARSPGRGRHRCVPRATGHAPRPDRGPCAPPWSATPGVRARHEPRPHGRPVDSEGGPHQGARGPFPGQGGRG